MADSGSNPHVVLLPSPGIGHLIPFVELAKRLALHHNLSVTIITFSNFTSHIHHAILSALPAGVSAVSLPPVPLDDLPATTDGISRISVMISRSIPSVREALRHIRDTTPRVAAFIIDLFCGDTLPIAEELRFPQFIFFTSSLFCLSMFLHLPTLHDSPEKANLLRLPGCLPLQATLISDMSMSDHGLSYMLHHSRNHDRVDGIMVNSFEAMEGGAAGFLRDRGEGKPPVVPVGPLVNCDADSAGSDRDESCIEWLDRQPDRSVLFVAFGSWGSLSLEQAGELAVGLEMSGQRFLWVIRKPGDDEGGDYFSINHADDLLGFLPQGFLERTKEKGMVVPFWVPQAKILAHAAVGGFLSHCGWNSCLESIVNGVPMIAWPLNAEQPMNALMLTEMKVALRAGGSSADGKVRKEEIAGVVRKLIEGEEGKDARRRMREVQETAVKAVSSGESSDVALAVMVNSWKSRADN
ncbi:Hydroquinone glucosyltransferase [Apostasia shenzhenica]|uniref:Glycosyltransferase n=1 Tax=Apostasia shenzhenica TaxID=1088818 RepID=A0A2I0AK63_9ASPA|nr:Hydroquinone glucosyltransferase [Apostasia shenzhenica]